ncbi:MAG: toll/interleukin-1 receptor domain-containing protein [Nitrospira sp.]|nr:toll/interleukin-1 receptor domain-containing protein [Nitrospira sp.]
MRVFISHSSHDKPLVEALALALHERGIEPWLDRWEIGPGDDIVASINAGLDEAPAGIVVFSAHTKSSRWVEAEVSYLTYARIVEGKVLIPVVLGEGAWVPPLLRPLARRGIEEIEAIADALLGRRGGSETVFPGQVRWTAKHWHSAAIDPRHASMYSHCNTLPHGSTNAPRNYPRWE